MDENINKNTEVSATELYTKWVENFTYRYNRTIPSAYTPQYGNTAVKDVNVHPNRPSKENLRKWLLAPQNYEDELRDFSEYLYYVVTEYSRLINHVGNILNFDYVLVPGCEPKGKNDTRFEFNKKKSEMWLKKFRPKDQFRNITMAVAIKGGKYYYLRLSDFIILQEMPEDYCYITAMGEYGYRYAVDMTFFDKYPSALNGYAPEFADWYNDFTYRRQYEREYNIYFPVPEKMGVVFKLDEFSPLVRPSFTGSFKDALQIEDYKDLLRLKTELDTWKVVFQEIPKDKDGIPTIDEGTASKFVSMVQSQLPSGVVTAATPFKIEPVSFDQSQNMNQIIGKGQSEFWTTTGSAPLFDGKQSGNMAVKMSILSDYNMMSQLYDQYERFVNHHLRLICGNEYPFSIKFLRRCEYFKDEDNDKRLTSAQNGYVPEEYMAALGYEPHQIMPMLKNSINSGIRDYLVPIKTSHTMSDKKDGAPKKNISELSDAGANTQDRGDNDERI